MPLYNYHCDNCGRDLELFNTVENRERALCGSCGNNARKVLSSIARPVIMEYYSESLDAYITGPRQKQRLMKAKGLSEAA